MKNNNLNYVKIPREIIYDKDLSSKRVIIFSYLCARRSLDDTVAFSTTELCHWSKLKPNYRNGKIETKKHDKNMHGIGLESVKTAVEKHYGTMDIHHNNKEFHVNIMLYL